MKLQYLGFLPLLIIVTTAHINFIKHYSRRQNIYDVNPLALITITAFWLFAALFGFVWGMTGFSPIQ